MASVRTFHVHDKFGIPDNLIREWLCACEKEMGLITVTTVYVPPTINMTARLTVIATKLDDFVPDTPTNG